jgi:hypothetical protein
VAAGYVILVRPAAPLPDFHPRNIWGYSLNTIVVYFSRDADRQRYPSDIPGFADPIVDYALRLGVPPKRGYHLVHATPPDQAANDACRWQLHGRCEDWECQGGNYFELAANRLDFFLCQNAFPDQPSCTVDITCLPSSDLPHCDIFPWQHGDLCEYPTYEPNLDDHAVPISITLGTTYRDVIYYSRWW